MAEGITLKLAYLLRDPNTGSVVVPDLYHIGGTWTVRALLAGYPGSTTLGDFAIQLPPPYTEEFGRYKAQYDAILNSANRGIGLKVEAYLNDVSAGQPVMSGVITKMALPLDGPWELSGADTLWWLQQSQLFSGEELGLFANTYTAFNIANAFYGTSEVLWDDGFSGWSGATHPNSSDYTTSGFTIGTDPVFGSPALTASVAGSYAIEKTALSQNQFGASYQLMEGAEVTIFGVAQGASGTFTGAGCNPGIWVLSDSTGANSLLVEMTLSQTASGSAAYNVGVSIFTLAGGVATLRASAANVFTNVPATFPFELTCVIYTNVQPGLAPKVAFRVLLNGKDTGCVFYDFIDWTIPASGFVGARFSTNGGTSPAVYINRLRFQGRTSRQWGTDRFATGQFYSGTLVASSLGGQGQTHLDMIIAAASFDGASLRKIPGAGAKADTIDYGLSLPTDFSTSVAFAEGKGGNVEAQGSALSNVAEVYGTETRLSSVPFGDSGGAVTCSSVATVGDMVLADTVSDVGILGFVFLTRYGRSIATRKGAPVVATQLRVVRFADLLRANNGWGPRELDFVEIHLPTYGIRHQRAQIVGYTVTEGSAEVTYYLTQFPEASLPQAPLQKLIRSADYLVTTYARR